MWTSFVLLPIGVIAPISVSHINSIRQNEKLNKIESIENSLLSQESISKDEQIKIFENVKTNDVLSLIKNKSSIVYKNFSVSSENDYESLNVYEEINNNIEKFSEITNKIINGELTIDDINSNLDNFKENNIDEYNKILNDINNKIEIEKSKEKENDNLNINKFSSKSNNKIVDIKIKDDFGNISTIKSDQIAFYLRAEKFFSKLHAYKNASYKTAIASSILTAASWAIAAFYWSAWWMFGSNVPFAVGATVQAGYSTYVTKISFDEYYKLESEAKNYKNIIYSQEFKNYKILYNELWEHYRKISDKLVEASNFAGTLIIKYGKFKKEYNEFIKLINQTFIKKPSNFITSKISISYIKFINKLSNKNIFKVFLKNINKRVFKYLTNLSTKKILMKALSWASSATVLIGIMDDILTGVNIVSNFILFLDWELSEW